VLSIKGTSAGLLGGGGPTVRKDKINDNLLFRYFIFPHFVLKIHIDFGLESVVVALGSIGHGPQYVIAMQEGGSAIPIACKPP